MGGKAKQTHKTRGARWWAALCVAIISLVVVSALAAAQPFARWQTRRWLQALHGVQGDFLDARLSFFPLVYGVSRLKLTQPERQTQEPILFAEDISLQLTWGGLLTGHLVARMQARGVKVVLEQPKPGGSGRLPDLSALIPVPVRLERLQVRQGEVLYCWVHQSGHPTMWFHDIEATLERR